jgi:ribosomal subunit interface protein
MKEVIAKKVEGFQRLDDTVRSCEVVVEKEGVANELGLRLHTGNGILYVDAQAGNVGKALDKAVERMERRLAKRSDKKVDRRFNRLPIKKLELEAEPIPSR